MASKLSPDRVYEYLKQNYPASVCQWAKKEDWVERDVPLSDILMDRRPGGRNMKKVEGIAKAINDGQPMEPVVLVETPEGHQIADGYHRTLAFRHAGKDRIRAWVATGEHGDGPWTRDMHAAKKNLSANAELFALLKGGETVADTQMSVEQRLERAEKFLAVLVGQAVMSDTPNPGGRRKKGYPENPGEYADPQDHAYPLDTEKHVRDAASRLGEYKDRYSPEKRAEIKRRIEEAEKRLHIGKYHEADKTHSAAEVGEEILGILRTAFEAEDTTATLEPDEVEALKFLAKAIKSETNERTNPQTELVERMANSFVNETGRNA